MFDYVFDYGPGMQGVGEECGVFPSQREDRAMTNATKKRAVERYRAALEGMENDLRVAANQLSERGGASDAVLVLSSMADAAHRALNEGADTT